jgi:tetratricopeptide (TPR) repeat protein
MSSSFAPVIAAALVSAAVGGTAGWLASSSEARAEVPEGAAAPGEPARDAALEAQLADLRRSIDELRELALASRTVAAPAPDEAALRESIEAAVARFLESRPAAAPAGADELSPAAAARARERQIADALDELLDPSLTERERERLWAEFTKLGLDDALVAEFEKRAELDPTDPDLKVDLGSAYLRKLFTVGNGPEAGLWANKADAAFDAALAIDEGHWDARFTKAVSLSFWPPIFGKQNEAISHFEKLVVQQQGQASRPDFAQTHLMLGNMYQQIGEKEKALAAWKTGAALFPDDEELRKKALGE